MVVVAASEKMVEGSGKVSDEVSRRFTCRLGPGTRTTPTRLR